MRIFFDTEFIEDGRTIDLISIGMVREDDETLYLVSSEYDEGKASAWVRENVLAQISPTTIKVTRKGIADRVRAFVGPDPEFWAYYADYDWVVLCQLYGTMMDLPTGWPVFCLDIQQERVRQGVEKLPKQESGEHNALADAQWNKRAWEYLQGQR